MNDLDELFKTCKEAVSAIIQSHTLAKDCEMEIDAAFDSLKSGLDDHDCDDGCSHSRYQDMDLADGQYLIEAKNLNEMVRIEKFIEELETKPYAP